MARRTLPKPIQKPDYDPKALGSTCSICPYKALGATPCKPRIEGNSRFLVVLDQPDPVSVKHGELRTTVSQKLLERGMAEAGADSVSYLYATACRRPKDAKDKDVEQATQSCQPRLAAEIAQASPPSNVNEPERKWLLALGDYAFRVSTGKLGAADAWRGSPVESVWPGWKTISSWDPYVIGTAKGSRYAAVWYTHLDRYVKLATGELADFDWGELVINKPLEALRRIHAVASRGGEYAMDIETSGLGWDVSLNCIGFAIDGLAVSVKVPYESKEIEALVRDTLRRGTMITQNGYFFDREYLRRNGYDLTAQYEDCLFASSILTPQLPKSLAFQAASEFHGEAHKSQYHADESGVLGWGEVTEELMTYNCKDCVVTLMLWRTQKSRFATYGAQLYQTLKDLAPIAMQMRNRGVYWNKEAAVRLREEYTAKIDVEVAQLKKAAKVFGLEDFNFQSNKQLKELYFSKFRVVPVRYTEKGEPSVDGDALTEYLKSDNPMCAEFSKKLMGLRTLWKMRAVYIDGCAPGPGETHSRGEWRSWTAISGRWSCTGRPLQTVPTDMRELFSAEPGHVLVESDVAALEVRSLALFSGAKTLLQMLADGEDIHLYNAENVFQRKLEKKSRERQVTKLIFFASAYRAAPDTVWRQVVQDFKDITVKQVEVVQRALWKLHPEVVAWWDSELKACAARGYYLEPISGRRVVFYGHPEPSLSVNMPNQSLGAHLMNKALIGIYNELDHEHEYVVSQIHDSICLSGPDEKKLLDLCHKHMVSTVEYEGRSVKIEIEAKAHQNYRLVK